MTKIDFASKPHWPGAFNPTKFSLLVFGPFIAIGVAVFYVYHYGFTRGDILNFALMSIATGLSITGGYHRLFAHRSYQCHPLLRWFYLMFGAAALEMSVYVWASDHRYHHRFVDSNSDPYSAKKGFFWAHMAWIFYNEPLDRSFDNALDLKNDPLVSFQHQYYYPLFVLFGLGVPTLIGFLFDRPFGGLLWGGIIRILFVHHSTYLINSSAHFFGKRPFSLKNTARDSSWLAFLSFGEGYHNFHHAFASDYRNGVRWWAFDPAKWMIAVFSKTGVTKNLSRTPDALIFQAMAEVKEEEAKILLTQHCSEERLNYFQPQLEEISKRFKKTVQDWDALKRKYQTWKKEAHSYTMSRQERKARKFNWLEEIRASRANIRITLGEYQVLLKALQNEARLYSVI